VEGWPSDFVQIVAALVQNPYMGIVIVDKNGYVTVANDTYIHIVGKTRDEVIGKYIMDVTSNSQLPKILETGEVHIADYWPCNGHDLIVTRFPIYNKEGDLIGAVGKSLFLDLGDAKALAKKVADLEEELAFYRDAIKSVFSPKYCFDVIVGKSRKMIRLKSMAEQVAQTGSTVLITGESGTGKELFAHSIHRSSPRAHYPFVRVNCAALPEHLLESELFGYEEGAFTGARKGGKPGKFELANKGTIFLDEIGDMPLPMQAKLLTVLQEREFERVGGTKPVRVDVRIIAATNCNLENLVEQGKFRADLYYRLNVVVLDIPPLRERLEDIPLLVQAILPRLNQRLNTNVTNVSSEAIQLLRKYHWPGNVRELENLLERAINLADLNNEKQLTAKHFPSLQKQNIENILIDKKGETLADAVEQLEKEMIRQVLKQTNYNKAQTAKLLGLHGSVLYRKLKKYNLG